MTHRPDPSRRKRRLIKLVVLAIVVILPASAYAADRAVRKGGKPRPSPSLLGSRARDGKPGHFDVREEEGAAHGTTGMRTGQAKLRRGLGRGAVLEVDRRTGSPAVLARREGFLTNHSLRKATSVALGFVRDKAAAFGIDGDDLARLKLRREDRSRGLTHLEWMQTYRGIPSLDTGLRANVDRDGRLVNVGGGLRPDLEVRSTSPKLSAAAALKRLAADVRSRRHVRQLSQASTPTRKTSFAGGHRASLVLFAGPAGVRLAWHLLLFDDAAHTYAATVDAISGRILQRDNLTVHAAASVFQNYPGAPVGGTQEPVTFPEGGASDPSDPWLVPDSGAPSRLIGNNAHVYSDPGDDLYISDTDPSAEPGTPSPGDEVPPTSGNWIYPQQRVDPAGSSQHCPSFGCTWDDYLLSSANSWQTNREQAGTQLFYFVNRFHDHLRDAPGIGFDEESRNFEATNTSGNGRGGDAVEAQVDDGADIEGGFPDDAHLNNANMTTLPDGQAPKMQMYLFSDYPYWRDDQPLGINDVNGADDAAIVYHEYTHGLSGRLVCCDSQGFNHLFGPQSGAMGEAWSDWYALDFLEAERLQPDTSTPGDMALGKYENLALRFEGIDCRVSDTSAPLCPGGDATGRGGFTYGDFGHVFQIDEVNNETGDPPGDGLPDGEVHADGEIWGQTLWDMRRSLIAAHGPTTGEAHARGLVTWGMRLVPTLQPDFLDMRDAILQADTDKGFGDRCLIWSVFAARGMGSNARSSNGDSATGITQSFANPCVPAATAQPGGTTSGSASGASVAAGSPGVATAPKPPAKPNLKHAKRRVRVDRHRRFRYSFRAAPGLKGRAGFVTRRKVRVSAKRRRRVTFARKSFRVGEGGKVTLRVRLSRKAYRILKRYRKLTVTVTVIVRNAAGLSAKSTRRLTLLAPRRHRR